jgi:putative flippase GtrA
VIRRFDRELLRQMFGFGMVGTAGFLTDAALFLAASQWLGLPVMLSRALAFIPATIVTWWLNRSFVFRTAGSGRRAREYGKHFGVQAIGIALNFAVFYFAVKLGLGRGSAQLVPLALGSGVAMVFNFIGARNVVFVR